MKIFKIYSSKAIPLALIGIWILCSQYAIGQNSGCAQRLSEAQLLYSEGKLQSIPLSLQPCMANGFTQEEKVKAYRLITLAYLFTDQIFLAEESFVELLKLSPAFEVDEESDPIALIDLYKRYRTSPVLSLHVVLGPNRTLVSRSLAYSTTDTPGEYAPKLGFQLGIGADVYLSRWLSIQVQLINSWSNFQYDNTLLDYSSLSYQEQQHTLSMPINVAYHFGKGDVQPFIFAGGQGQYLISAKADLSRIQDIGATQRENGVSVKENRHPLQLFWQAGAGFHYRKGRLGSILRVSYSEGLFNQTPANLRYSNKQPLYRFGYVDDDFRLRSVGIEAGVTYSIYTPKKLKDKHIVFPTGGSQTAAANK